MFVFMIWFSLRKVEACLHQQVFRQYLNPNHLKLLVVSTSSVDDEDLGSSCVKRVKQANGIKIQVDFLNFEALRPSDLAVVAANTGEETTWYPCATRS
ncbi:unnamed protein product [Eruca vesicaria subsp. sativa]|uniref:Uncharacterized protein n=1 Tax=Eruca vesicaria subsp. sativa TaxID=29727 RepID=A0ABC8JI21_ERUVS|nr:unnamed protein product [Eruca vesicaria subsp. sativa]